MIALIAPSKKLVHLMKPRLVSGKSTGTTGFFMKYFKSESYSINLICVSYVSKKRNCTVKS